MSVHAIPWPRPAREAAPPVHPVFLPFRGCPRRCVFCAQDRQTGRAPAPLEDILRGAEKEIVRRGEAGAPPVEIAFYGGSFTSQPRADVEACVDLHRRMARRGFSLSFRCSARPDAADADLPAFLRGEGCRLVELGVQTFDDASLALAGRGHDAATTLAACRAVHAAGLKLGVQLLPGMPGSTPEIFLRDVSLALDEAHADVLRFYPCVVPAGTGLERLWREGRFIPWTADAAVAALAPAWLQALRAGVPVIRMGLAPEPAMRDALLAGPWDPCLGSRVQGRALFLAVRGALPEGARIARLAVPDRCRGIIWGSGGELRPLWRDLGLTRENLAFSSGEDALILEI